MNDEPKYGCVKEDEERGAYLITVRVFGSSPDAALKLAKPENIIDVRMEAVDNRGKIDQVFGRR